MYSSPVLSHNHHETDNPVSSRKRLFYTWDKRVHFLIHLVKELECELVFPSRYSVVLNHGIKS